MWPPRQEPQTLHPAQKTRVPEQFRRLGISEHSINQKRGRPLGCFIEGPTAVGNDLYVVDIPYGRIFAINQALPDAPTESSTSEHWKLVVEYDGEPNGLAWHPGRKTLIIADFKKGLLELNLERKSIEPILTRYNGEAFKGLNDVIVDSRGNIFFTDQGMSGLQDPSGRVFRLCTDGRLDVLLRNCPSPNGLALDKKETTLFVAMTRDNSVWCAPLYPDGSVQRTGRFSSYYGLGGPDGLILDIEGNLFVAHSSLGAVFVHRPNGEPLAQILSSGGQSITNMTWGGKEGKTLMITESQEGVILQLDWHCQGLLSGLPASEFLGQTR